VSKRHGHSVLCIGNDPVHLNLRCALLKEHGWNVISSGSGHEGVIRFGLEQVDAVIVDLNGDAAESALITAELKRLRPEVPVIMLVGQQKDLVPGAAAQADAMVAKSEESRLLLEALRRITGAS